MRTFQFRQSEYVKVIYILMLYCILIETIISINIKLYYPSASIFIIKNIINLVITSGKPEKMLSWLK